MVLQARKDGPFAAIGGKGKLTFFVTLALEPLPFWLRAYMIPKRENLSLLFSSCPVEVLRRAPRPNVPFPAEEHSGRSSKAVRSAYLRLCGCHCE